MSEYFLVNHVGKISFRSLRQIRLSKILKVFPEAKYTLHRKTQLFHYARIQSVKIFMTEIDIQSVI